MIFSPKCRALYVVLEKGHGAGEKGMTLGGGGTLIFSSYVGSGQASTVHPKKISEISSTQKKIFEILPIQKSIPHSVP